MELVWTVRKKKLSEFTKNFIFGNEAINVIAKRGSDL
jgi:hypothetical protein